jgi:type I restriction enzyme M protein
MTDLLTPDQQALLQLLPQDGDTIGNGKARETLGWDEDRYTAAKDALLQAGLIATGRGRGGSIRRNGEPHSGEPAGTTTAPTSRKAPSSDAKPAHKAAKTQGSTFEQAFRNIDDILRKEAGCSNELDYTEQTSWIIFLKYLDDLEQTKRMAAELKGERYLPLLDEAYRWPVWACPKTTNAAGERIELDHHTARTGPDLVDFVDQKLFPYLRGFKQRATGPRTLEYKIGEIFGELTNRIKSGYNLREILDAVDRLHFQRSEEQHELSALYETKIQRMGNAGRNGGEYYTPRPLIRAIVQVLHPRIGETVYDGAVGSAGFLCEAYAHMLPQTTSTKDHEVLQTSTFFGKEKKGLAYVIGIMNMILHGIEAPNIIHTNTLAENLGDIQAKDQYNVVLANPPFGGKERPEVQQNFPIKTGETAFLFLQHFIKSMKAGGRAGIVIKNTFLSNTDNASISLRRKLLEDCDLHTILDMPGGTFQGAGVKTVVLFFEKGRPTRRIWYYQLDPGRNMGKTNPLNEADLAEFVRLAKNKGDSANSWSRSVAEVLEATETYDLSVKNPNRAEEAPLREPKAILQEMRELDAKTKELMEAIQRLL